jgi:hypothetical protein
MHDFLNQSSFFNKLAYGFGSIFLFASASVEIATAITSDLQSFIRRQDLLPDVNGDAGSLNSFRYDLSDLASLDRF